MAKRIVMLVLVVVVTVVTGRVAGVSKSVKAKTPAISVGVFDSRAVACAWIRSKANAQRIEQIQAEYKKAEAKGDQKLMEQMVEEQRIAHKQVFGNEPIDDVLEKIKDKLGKIASDAGVDILVSKWEVAYQNKSAKFVDVTWEMVNLFDPSDETIGIVKDIIEIEPVSMKDGEFVSEKLPKRISKRELKKIYKEFSITTEKDKTFVKRAKRVLVTYDVHERLVDVFKHSFEHSLVSAFKSNGTEAVIVTNESPKAEGFEPDAAMHIDIQPLYRERKDGYQAIVGTDFEVSLTETATGKKMWQETGKVDYIRMFGARYTAHAGIRKEFAWHTTEAIVSVFAAEINGQEPARIYTVTEERQEHGQRVD